MISSEIEVGGHLLHILIESKMYLSLTSFYCVDNQGCYIQFSFEISDLCGQCYDGSAKMDVFSQARQELTKDNANHCAPSGKPWVISPPNKTDAAFNSPQVQYS